MSDRYRRTDDRKEDLRELMADYPAIAQEFQRRYEMSWLYHENALEGLVLTEQELAQALEYQTVADASLQQTITIVRNHKRALDMIRTEAAGKKVKLTMTLIRTLCETLGKDTAAAERAREKEKPLLRQEIPLHRTYFHDISSPSKIQVDLQKLIDFTGTAEFREFHAIKQAAYVHWQFLQIFPFIDQSGRVARLLGNLYLLRAGYLPVVIHAIDRHRYFDTLRMPLATLRTLLLEAIDNTLLNAGQFIRAERRAELRRLAASE